MENFIMDLKLKRVKIYEKNKTFLVTVFCNTVIG